MVIRREKKAKEVALRGLPAGQRTYLTGISILASGFRVSIHPAAIL